MPCSSIEPSATRRATKMHERGCHSDRGMGGGMQGRRVQLWRVREELCLVESRCRGTTVRHTQQWQLLDGNEAAVRWSEKKNERRRRQQQESRGGSDERMQTMKNNRRYNWGEDADPQPWRRIFLYYNYDRWKKTREKRGGQTHTGQGQ